MPIFRAGSDLIYFAHVPKCGGTSVEHYLKARFGPLAMWDPRHLLRPASERWSKSSPQHIPVADLAHLFPLTLFDASFAVVRHPVDRLVSVFLYQRDINRRIGARVRFSNWLETLPRRRETAPWHLDNHPRPMTDLVPEGARIFRLEDGLQAVADWIDALPGGRPAPGPIGQRNSYDTKLSAAGRKKGAEVQVTPRDRDLITRLHAADFERFGYDPKAGS